MSAANVNEQLLRYIYDCYREAPVNRTYSAARL